VVFHVTLFSAYSYARLGLCTLVPRDFVSTLVPRDFVSTARRATTQRDTMTTTTATGDYDDDDDDNADGFDG